MQVKATEIVAGMVVAIGGLAGWKLYDVVSMDWQVSMVLHPASSVSPDAIHTLAAPQQFPSAQVISPLYGLKVPLETAFSHLALMVPGAGTVWASSKALMVTRS